MQEPNSFVVGFQEADRASYAPSLQIAIAEVPTCEDSNQSLIGDSYCLSCSDSEYLY